MIFFLSLCSAALDLLPKFSHTDSLFLSRGLSLSLSKTGQIWVHVPVRKIEKERKENLRQAKRERKRKRNKKICIEKQSLNMGVCLWVWGCGCVCVKWECCVCMCVCVLIFECKWSIPCLRSLDTMFFSSYGRHRVHDEALSDSSQWTSGDQLQLRRVWSSPLAPRWSCSGRLVQYKHQHWNMKQDFSRAIYSSHQDTLPLLSFAIIWLGKPPSVCNYTVSASNHR